MSSILGTGGTCGFNLDLIKCPSTSSTCSSTLSKSSSVSSLAITTKRARTPRKRPNQSYIEAAAILSAACPNVFSIKKLHEKLSRSLSSLSSSSLSSSDILPSFPVLNDSDFLIESPPRDPNPSFKFKRSFNPIGKSSAALRAISPPKSLDYDVDSIFDDEGGDGIDSIMGKLSMNDCDSNSAAYPAINPCFGKFGLDYGFGQGQNNIRQLMRGVHDKDLGRPMAMVQMDDLVPKFNVLPPLGKKTTQKKKKKLDELNDDLKIIQTTTASRITTDTKLEGQVMSGLGLKLNLEEVIKAWGARGFPFSCEAGTEESSNEIASRLAEIDLPPSAESAFLRYLRAFQKPDKSIRCRGTREASLQRYREKRSTRHFTKKICYQVRKVNADCKPRMKGCFVKKNHTLHGAVGDEGQ